MNRPNRSISGRRRLRPPRRARRPTATTARRRAEGRLSSFRNASKLAVSLIALLIIVGIPVSGAAPHALAQETPASGDTAVSDTVQRDAERSVQEATTTIRDLVRETYAFLPKIAIAFTFLILAAVLARSLRWVLSRAFSQWERARAVTAMVSVVIWVFALGIALSVLAGDARALVGSIGLFGLALSWALQTPIESFTGWLLVSFRGYYRIGDRIGVGDVFGDVYRIDVLTTTVWEAGGPNKPVRGAQPTGGLVTFPNSEILRSNIVNYTRDFPYVWDELTVGVANESRLDRAVQVVGEVATEVVGKAMAEPARRYADLLSRQRVTYEVDTEPVVYVSAADAWTNVTVRYLVPVRQRREWSTRLLLALDEALGREEEEGRVYTSYPRIQSQPLPPPVWTGDESADASQGA